MAACWIVACAAIALAMVRVVTAEPRPRPAAADATVARRVFDAIASSESSMRARAAMNFPGDLWSQGDDFHAMEWQRAAQLASMHRIALGDALRAIDDGMRAGWARPGTLQATVAPCRPRPVY